MPGIDHITKLNGGLFQYGKNIKEGLDDIPEPDKVELLGIPKYKDVGECIIKLQDMVPATYTYNTPIVLSNSDQVQELFNNITFIREFLIGYKNSPDAKISPPHFNKK